MDWKGYDGSERSWEQVRRYRVSSYGGVGWGQREGVGWEGY